MKTLLQNGLRAWMGFVARRAWLVLGLVVLSLGASGWYTVSNLGINTSTANMVPADAPFRLAEEAYWDVFPQNDDNVVFVIEDKDAFEADRTAALVADALQRNTSLFTDVYAPGIGPFFDRNGLLYLEPDALAETLDRLAQAQAGLAVIAGDPSLRGLFEALSLALEAAEGGEPLPPAFQAIMQRLADATRVVNEGGTPTGRLIPGVLDNDGSSIRVIQAKLRLDVSQAISSADGIEWFRAMVNERRAAGDIAATTTVRMTGEVVMGYEELQSVAQGMALAGLVSLTLLVLILGWGMRSVRLIAASYLTLFIGLIWMGAFATATIGELNMLSVSVTVLFIGLGIDHAIHFCMRYAEALANSGDKVLALQEAGGDIGPALMLCALSSAIGFLSFIPTDYRGFADLGVIAAGGMLMALIASLVALPAILAVFGAPGRKVWRGPVRHLNPGTRSKAAIAIIVLGVLALPLASGARFDSSTIALKDPESEGVQTLNDLTEDGGNSGFTANVIVEGRQEAEALAAKLEALPEVDWVMTPADFVPADQDLKLDMIDEASLFLWPVLNPEKVAPPRDQDLIAAAENFVTRAQENRGLDGNTAETVETLADEVRRLLESGAAVDRLKTLQNAAIPGVQAQVGRLQDAMSAGPVDFAGLPPNLLSRDIGQGNAWSLTIFPTGDMSNHQEMRAFSDALTAAVPGVSGRPISEVATGEIVVNSFITASGLALTLITILLLVVLRRITDVLFVLIPLALAFSLTVGVTVLTGMAFNFANVIVLPLLLGFGVDSGIHMVLRRRDHTAVDAMMGSSTPRAIVLSALTTIASFVSLSLSPHWGTASLGILLTLAMSLIVLSTVIVLPALLRWRDGRSTALGDSA